jgi:sugar/nucleoside kinase (ribokinase family)
VDPNWDPDGRWDPIDDVISRADVCLTNLAEAKALTGVTDPEAAARDLARRAGRDAVLVVKLGAAGGLVLAEDVVVRADAPAVAVVDTTGAGDSFDAGFIAGWSAGWPMAQSLDLALICGSASTRRPGGVDGQPTLAEARSLADEIGRPLPPDLVAAPG